MKINSKFHYAIKTLVYFAIHNDGNGVFQKDIASKLGFPVKFLNHVITALKVAGLIHRVAGGRKGYILSYDPSEITIYQVYRAVEPELEIYPCLNCNGNCQFSECCATHLFLFQFNQNIKNLLASATIGQLTELQKSIIQSGTTKIPGADVHFFENIPV